MQGAHHGIQIHRRSHADTVTPSDSPSPTTSNKDSSGRSNKAIDDKTPPCTKKYKARHFWPHKEEEDLKRSKNGPETGPNSPKTGQNWPFLAARASGEQRTASEARGSTVPAIRKPHPALCHPGGSRVLRWLTFCSAQDGHRATQKQAKNWPKRAKTGHFWLRERAASGGQRAKREAAPSLLYEIPIQPCATRGVPGC